MIDNGDINDEDVIRRTENIVSGGINGFLLYHARQFREALVFRNHMERNHPEIEILIICQDFVYSKRITQQVIDALPPLPTISQN